MFQFSDNVFKVKNTKYLIYILSFVFIFSFQAQAEEAVNADPESVKEITSAEKKAQAEEAVNADPESVKEITSAEKKAQAEEAVNADPESVKEITSAEKKAQAEEAVNADPESVKEITSAENMLKREIRIRQRLKNIGLLGNNGTFLSDVHIYNTLRRKISRKSVAGIKNKNIIFQSLFFLGGEGIFLFNTEYGLILEGQLSIEQGDQVFKAITEMKPKKISINTRGDNDTMGFYKQLADYVSQNNIDIHITGLCANACANYLLPAVKRIIIEPYGVIAFQNSYAGELEDVKFASENEFKNIKIAFENSYLYNNMNFTEFLYSFLISKKNQLLIHFLSRSEAELFQKINMYLTSRDAVDFLDLSQEDFYILMDQLTDEEMNKIKQFFIHNVYNNKKKTCFLMSN